MPRKLEWIHPNKARISTGHKTFDRQCESVMQGQLLGTCQLSMCIRPVHEVECNGQKFPLGHLRQFDLKSFPDLPYNIRLALAEIHVPVILYEFRHWGKRDSSGEHRKIVDGYIITTYEKRHDLVYRFARRAAGDRILDWVLPYLIDEEENHAA